METQYFEFPWCSIREDLSIDVSITNVGLILRSYGDFFSRGTDRRTDMVLESSHGNILAHKKILTQSSKLVVSCLSLYASPEDGDA